MKNPNVKSPTKAHPPHVPNFYPTKAAASTRTCTCSVHVSKRERDRDRKRETQTIIENSNNKHHKRWKVKLPYESQQHETKLSPNQTPGQSKKHYKNVPAKKSYILKKKGEAAL